ncbi:hypothetical protein [Paragemmobacter aquarius]|uniref:hypothetical protein n=1 Tax=Paragemmobacter aquarius TaxID=2169400 RepID=UPI0022A6E20B|nr:hypothetical protein [Gemmobacter aquarius]
MSRQTIPLATADLSAFVRHLAGQLARNATPGHVELINMLARAAGFRNFQHLRAATVAQQRFDRPEPPCDLTLVERACAILTTPASCATGPPAGASKSSASGPSGHSCPQARRCMNGRSAPA